MPFTYAQARARYGDVRRDVRVNLARRRVPKPHVTIKYLEPDFAELFVGGAGAGSARTAMPGWGLPGPGAGPQRRGRGAGAGDRAAAAGVQLPAGLRDPAAAVPRRWRRRCRSRSRPGWPRARKFRTTWIDYDALAAVHQLPGLDRAASGGRIGVAAAGAVGRAAAGDRARTPGRAGQRRSGCRWDDAHGPGERRGWSRPDGGTCLLAVRAGGGPFTAWDSVFARASDRIRRRFEPRFPHVHPHRLRHSFAMATLEWLVSGYYAQAAGLVTRHRTRRRARMRRWCSIWPRPTR